MLQQELLKLRGEIKAKDKELNAPPKQSIDDNSIEKNYKSNDDVEGSPVANDSAPPSN